MELFLKYIIIFIMYSFLGWIIEVTMIFFDEKKFVNRGFFIGPCCPIYGFGSILLVFLLGKYQNEPFALFALSMIICAVLEYFTSWILEKIFKMRWWDYSHNTFNINGRICLETMVPFGVCGILVVRHINPFVLSILNRFSYNTIIIMAAILLSLFVIDLIISTNLIFNFKSIAQKTKKDSTEEIKNYIKRYIHSDKALYNRLINAFPRLQKVIKENVEKRKMKKTNSKKNN